MGLLPLERQRDKFYNNYKGFADEAIVLWEDTWFLPGKV